MKPFSFLVHTYFLIALAAVALSVATQVQLGSAPSFLPYLAAIFFLTLLDYNLHQLLSLRNAAPPHRPKFLWALRHITTLKIFVLFSFLASTATLFFLTRPVLILLASLAILTGLYSFPVSRKRHQRPRILQITGIKTFLIALVWTFVTVAIPLLASTQTYTLQHILFLFAERFTFIFAIAIPFDIRDMLYDKFLLAATIPIAFGEKRAWFISNIALAISLAVALIHSLTSPSGNIFPFYTLSIAITFLLINFRPLHRHPYYHHGLLDGAILLHGLLISLSFYFN